MLFYLIYFSKAKSLMDEEGLLRLLVQSRSFNQSKQITGMLLYIEGRFITDKEGRFMQVIEGREVDIRNLYQSIEQDDRHHRLIILKEQHIRKRFFNNWTMGFKILTLDEYSNIPGNFDLGDDFLESDDLHTSHIPLNYLKSFYKLNLSHSFFSGSN